MTTILDPTDERKPVVRQITPRSGALTGTVALLDIRKPRGDVLLDEIERQLVPALKRAGASGIITYPINKVIH